MNMGLGNIAMAQEASMVKPPGQSNGQVDAQQARSSPSVGATASAERAQAVQTETAVKPTPATASATKIDFAAEREAVVIDYEKVPIGGPDKFAKSMAMKSAKAHEDAVSQDVDPQTTAALGGKEDLVEVEFVTKFEADAGGEVDTGDVKPEVAAAPTTIQPATERQIISTVEVSGDSELAEVA